MVLWVVVASGTASVTWIHRGELRVTGDWVGMLRGALLQDEDKEMAMSKIIGIDLGTTNSVVAVMEGDAGKVLTNVTLPLIVVVP